MRELKTIEMHTCGEPARIVIDGMPELRGSTMQEKEQDLSLIHICGSLA